MAQQQEEEVATTIFNDSVRSLLDHGEADMSGGYVLALARPFFVVQLCACALQSTEQF
jgi:hypothetical protein